MILTSNSTQNGQSSSKSRRRTNVQSAGYHETIVEAIQKHQVLCLEYQGNGRRIIPMVFGILKNGRKAILCYKIVESEGQPAELYLRLYHLEKIRHLHGTNQSVEINRKIDYYLTKHFGQVHQKV